MRNQKIEKRGNELVISWQESRIAGAILTFMGTIWTTMGLFLVVAEAEPFLTIMPIIGGLVLYTGLVFLLNRTKILASLQSIRVERGPLPWFGAKEVRTADIEQFFIMENGQKKVGNKVTPLYALKAKLKSTPHKPVTLVGLLDGKEKALEMETALERHLNIQDVAINIPEDPRLTKFKERFPVLKDLKMPGPINEGKPGAVDTPASDYKFDLDTGQERSAPEVAGIAPRLIEGYAEQDAFARRLGDHLHLTGEDRVIISHVQYDWSDGRSDIAFRLQTYPAWSKDGRGSDAESTDVYAEQAEGRKYLYYEERLLSDDEHEQLGFFNAEDPPNIVNNGEEKYYRRNEVSGYRFVDHGRSVNQIYQWIYFTTASHDRFRVIQAPGGSMRVYIQEPIAGDNLRVSEGVKERRNEGREK